MHIARSKIQYLSTTILIVVGVLVWVLSCGNMATADMYIDSAHGNTSIGVNRSTAVCEYWPGGVCSTGSCAHCHDTFDPNICENDVNGLMLFAARNPTSKTSNFCLECHRGSSGSVQVGGITNNDYGATFGGGSAMFNNIRRAFNDSGTYSSFHNLTTVRNYARDDADWGTWVTDDTNACVICHDQHFSHKNFPVEPSGYGGVETAVRRGNDVNDYPGDLWGDESGTGRLEMMSELMSDWATTYQAPVRGDSGYEPGPAGSTIQDGSNLPNYVWACAETCHRLGAKGRQPVNWQDTSSSEWPGDPSMHGEKAANGRGFGVLKDPYSEASRGVYVLSCTDCHEPHGSTNPTLLRTSVNGVSGLSTGGPGSSSAGGYWYYWCGACHDLSPHPVIWPEARCGQYVGCHMSTGVGGGGGNHGCQF